MVDRLGNVRACLWVPEIQTVSAIRLEQLCGTMIGLYNPVVVLYLFCSGSVASLGQFSKRNCGVKRIMRPPNQSLWLSLLYRLSF